MAHPYLKAVLANQPVLFAKIYEFNMVPARFIHPSWVDPFIKAPLFQKLKHSARAEKKLSTLILEKYELEGQPFYDFDDPGRRLALIDPETLARLVFFTGTALNAGRIAGVIERTSLLTIRKSLGERAYLFALKSVPFIVGRMEIILPEQPEMDDIKPYMIQCGMNCLAACVGHEPDSYTRRLLFKFPKRDSLNFKSGTPAMEKDKAWTIMKKVLLKEVDPGWAPYIS